METDLLRKYLEYYQDLGIKTIYKRTAAPTPVADAEPPAVAAPPAEAPVPAVPAVIAANRVELPSLAPSGDSLFQILTDLGDCKRCRLHEGRKKIVFGVGNERAPLVFVGEGP